jgi:hypothetical protein
MERGAGNAPILLLGPLGLTHTGFFTDTSVGYKLAASHAVKDDQAVVQPHLWMFPQALNPNRRTHLQRS